MSDGAYQRDATGALVSCDSDRQHFYGWLHPGNSPYVPSEHNHYVCAYSFMQEQAASLRPTFGNRRAGVVVLSSELMEKEREQGTVLWRAYKAGEDWIRVSD